MMKVTMATPTDIPQGDSLGLTQERFGFTLFMSVCVHAVIILGIGFTATVAPAVTRNLEITIAAYRSTEAPEDPDFLAQANQQASGTEDRALAPATPFTSTFYANQINPLQQYLTERPTTPTSSDEIIARTGGAQKQEVQPEQPQPDLEDLNSEQLGDAVASLQAQLDRQRQEYAKRPRRHTISSASTQQDRDAQYLDNWRKRIEVVGNMNYPKEASSEGIYGTLRVMVAINPDGSVNDIRILRSSGERVLDEAAIRIVQQAAPFQAFPPEMRSEVDVLEIIRTWQFQRGNTFSSF
jgi:protein TonB